MIFHLQTISDIAVIVGSERGIFVLDDLLVYREFFKKILFNVCREAGRSGSLVLDAEAFGIIPVLFQEHKKPPFLDSQDLLGIVSFDFIL